MRFQILAIAATLASFAAAGRAAAAADAAMRISGPHVHDNLAVYFVHGRSAEGPVPLTLAEALEKGRVKVVETGEVNALKVENLGDEDIFIQSGDIVKGGKQDRALTTSLILKPKSGEVPLASFCVEHGRWSSRGVESSAMFSSASEAMPSRAAKLAMRAPIETAATGGSARGHAAPEAVYARQSKVWESVANTQQKLSATLSADVAAPASATSLQLSLENEKLKKTRAAYVEALKAAGTSADDIVGYAFAVNGKVNSADVYASNGLFRKMWEKQLQSAATEAIGEKSDKAEAAPAADVVKAFLDEAKKGAVRETAVEASKLELRDSVKAVYSAAAPAPGGWQHENYLAKH